MEFMNMSFNRLIIVLVLIITGVSISAADDSPAPSPLNIRTAGMHQLKQAYLQAKIAAAAPLKAEYKALLDKYLSQAKADHKAAKSSGNSKKMALGRKAKAMFTKCYEEFESGGDFSVPESNRRELSEILEKFAAEKKAIDDKAGDGPKAVERDYAAKFAALALAQPDMAAMPKPEADKLIAEKFVEFVATEIKEPEPDPGAIDTAMMAPELQPPPATPVTPVIASNGDGGQWVDIFKWTGDMMGNDMLDIVVVNREKDSEEKQFNPMGGDDSIFKFKVFNTLLPRLDYSFRLMRVPGLGGVEVVEWPGADNEWNMMTRVMLTGDTVPEKHGFVLQASVPPGEFDKAFKGAKLADPVEGEPGSSTTTKTGGDEITRKNLVKLPVKTKPKGVVVLIDGKPYSGKDGKTAKTPVILRLPPGECDIGLKKFGYLTKTFKGFTIAKGKRVVCRMVEDPDIKTVRIPVPASQKGWKPAKVEVENGDMITIEADGAWSCGEPKDKCGPEGYPNNKRFYKYYLDPAKDQRLVKNCNYGALLAKIGEDGKPMVVGNGKKFKADTAGQLYLSVNEREGRPRSGNNGAIKVTIGVSAE